MIRRHLTYLRRSWCVWRNHPIAEWSPVIIDWGDETPDANVTTTVFYRCALHDWEPPGG